MVKSILFIANPKSRDISEDETEAIISRFADEYNFTWDIYYTRQIDYASQIRQKLQEYLPGIVIVVGGDGTINQVATEILLLELRETELGIIPAGSANGLAYNLGIPSDFALALEIILTNEPKPLDVIKLNEDNYCYHLSDVGINARIVKRFEKEGSRGLMGYGKQMIKELFSKRTVFSFNLTTKELEKKYRAEMLVIANARYFGTGAVINPIGRPDDGRFEIIIIRPYPWWILFYLIRMMFFSRLDALKYIRVITTSAAEIVFDSPQDLQADGEIISEVKKLKISILPSAIKVRYGEQIS